MGAEVGLRRRVRGLSEAEFRQRYGTEAACRAALFQLRWGKGWVCPACGHGRCAELKGRAVYQCNRCKHQVGLTAGTVFHWTKLGHVPGRGVAGRLARRSDRREFGIGGPTGGHRGDLG